MSWIIRTAEDARGAQLLHVTPLEDLRDHADAADCWCKPTVEGDGFAVHNSLDGREAFERGERLPS